VKVSFVFVEVVELDYVGAQAEAWQRLGVKILSIFFD
jgi:hypothetical protein